MNSKITVSCQYYFLALTADLNIEAANIEIALTGYINNVGIVYQARRIALRLSNIIFYQISSNTQVYYVYQSEETLIYYANISFTTTGQQFMTPKLTANTTSITDAKQASMVQNTVYGKLDTPPCISCVLPDQELSKNCFGCPFGQKNNGNDVCVCEYTNSTMNPNTNRCEHIYQGIFNPDGNYYFSECKSNTQLTIKYDGSVSSTQISVFKDDSCNIVNVFVDGSMTISGSAKYISGLVRYSTRNIQYVYSSLNLWSKTSTNHLSLIINEVNGDVALKGITLNGRLNSTVYGSSLAWAAGVLVYVPARRTVTVSAVRVLGLEIFVNGYYYVSFIIGLNQGSSKVNNILITSQNDLNLTGVPVSPDGIDLNQIQFPCKGIAQSEELKDSIRLKQFLTQFSSIGKQTNMHFNLQQSGGVIGCNQNATAIITNVSINASLNGSQHYSGGAQNVGFLVGISENSALTATRAYCDGKIIVYRRSGVVGAINNGNATLIAATSFYLDSDQYSGFLGSSQNTQISAKIAVDGQVDGYSYYSSLFGTSRDTVFNVTEAIGSVYFAGYSCATYLADCYTTTFNGASCSNGGRIYDDRLLLVNNC